VPHLDIDLPRFLIDVGGEPQAVRSKVVLSNSRLALSVEGDAGRADAYANT
jgi:hypothetical protein